VGRNLGEKDLENEWKMAMNFLPSNDGKNASDVHEMPKLA